MTLSWEERIATAEREGRFTDADKDAADVSWLTCAVGERAAQDGLDAVTIVFSDEIIGSAGVEFGIAVRENRIAAAREWYETIQAEWKRLIAALTPEQKEAYAS